MNYNPQTDFSIHPDTGIGYVSITVSNLEYQIAFYQQALGFQLRHQEGNRVYLGTFQRDLLELVENPIASRYRRVTGLYHQALLYPDRRELARAVARILTHQIPNSPTDHIMTKTTYLDDQEGNGVELYCESPEDGSWELNSGKFITRRADGSLSSGREPLDVEALFSHLEKDDRLDANLPEETKIGHIHLHVRDLPEALAFYNGILGFDFMGMDPAIGMGFVSAGGYHHHIGLNTWQGVGAPSPPDNALGLNYFSVQLPDQTAYDQVLGRVQDVGIPITKRENGSMVFDPSRNGIHLSIRK